MRFSRVAIEAIAYDLPPTVVTSAALEDRIAPLYQALRIQKGQLEALTGIRERRYWPANHTMAEGATRAAKKALARSKVCPTEIGMLIYSGVCRDALEPATACAVAAGLELSPQAQVYDISNACLAVMNGILQIASAIELGHVRAGMVVSCESARQIVDLTIERMLVEPTMDSYRHCLATLTGGSGAIAVVVADKSLVTEGHDLVGGVMRNDTRWYKLCRWGPDTGIPATMPMRMDTDAVGVMEHGVELGLKTWQAFLEEMSWTTESIDRTICHQVGAPHRDFVLKQLGVPPEKDFVTYEFLGNIGTVSLPITAALAAERGFLQKGHRTAFCGIGSGLNCLILGVEW